MAKYIDHLNDTQDKLIKRKILKFFQSKQFDTDKVDNIFENVKTYCRIERMINIKKVCSGTRAEIRIFDDNIYYDTERKLCVLGFIMDINNTLFVIVSLPESSEEFIIELF